MTTPPSFIHFHPDEVAARPLVELRAFLADALTEASHWLHVHGKGTDPTVIVPVREWAQDVYDRVRRGHPLLRSDIRELLVRADRALGLAIRNGQRAGTVRRTGAHGGPLPSSQDFVTRRDTLSKAVYPLTDGVGDAQFEDALAHVNRIGDLGRLAVARHLHHTLGSVYSRRVAAVQELAERGYNAVNIGEELFLDLETVKALAAREGIELPDARRFRSTRSGGHITRPALVALVDALGALGMVLDSTQGLHPSITAGEASRWLTEIARVRRNVTTLTNHLKERSNDRDSAA